MKAVKLLFTLIVSGFLLISCVSPEKKVAAVNYINDHGYGTNISALLAQASKSIYRIQLNLVYKQGGKKQESVMTGIAFAVDNRRLFTAAHLTHMNYTDIDTPFGMMRRTIEKKDKLKEWISIVRDDGSKWPLKVIYTDEKNDFAVLESMNEVVAPIYKIGNSDKFNLLDTIISVSDFGIGMSTRLGHIAQTSIVKYDNSGKQYFIDRNFFGFTSVIARGDSGSPIFVMRDGRLEVGGITSFIMTPISGIGYGVKITPIMELLYADSEHTSWVAPLLKKQILSSKPEKIFYNIDKKGN